MYEILYEKAPGADVVCADITQYAAKQRFDYIFISSGSVSLFTDMELCKAVLKKMKELLLPEEFMDFQTHLYSFGEMEAYLEEAGFKVEAVYSDYSKHAAEDDSCEMFLFECTHKKPPTPQRNFML